jgi:DNA-binding beta-propeller fold protein YncE
MTPPSVAVGLGPADVVFDSARNTAYVTDNANGEGTGLLAMINTTHCNGDDSSGCAAQPSATTPTGRAPLLAGLDPLTGTLYVTNFSDASLFLYNTADCNAAGQSGCPKLPPEVIVGNGPDDVALDPTSDTIYVPDFLDGTVSLVPTGP